MKKIILILFLFTIASAWRTTIDSSQVRNFFRFYKFPNDQFLFVNSSDSTFDTAGVVAEKFGIRDITFPQLISFDTSYGGCYVYVPNSDQSLYINSGSSGYNPDSGAGLIITGENSGSTGDLFLYGGNTGNIDFYGLNNFKFFNGVDTLKFYYNSGDDGFIINSKRVEITGRQGVGHGLAIDSFYVAVDDTFLVRNGSVGIGTNDVSVVEDYTYAQTTRILSVNDDTYLTRFNLLGNSVAINLVDNAGAVNDKWLDFSVDGGIGKFNSLNDNGSGRINNILVMDMGTGNVGMGTTTPHVVASNTYGTSTLHLNVYDASNPTYFNLQGGNGAYFNFVNLGAGSNDKWMQSYNYNGEHVVRSLNDDASVRVGNIRVIDLGTGDVTFGYNVNVTGDFTADSIYGAKIGTNAAVACSLKDGTALRATGNAFWHKVGKAFRVQVPELSGNVTSGQVTRIYFATGTLPTPITSNVYKTIWVNGEGTYAVKCACYGGSAALIICADPGLTSLGDLTPLTINEFTFDYIVY